MLKKKKLLLIILGVVHNYLLDSYFANTNCITLRDSRNMDAFFNAFKDQMLKNDKYYVPEEVLTRSYKEIEYFQDIMDLKIDRNFYNNARYLVLKKIDDRTDISDEVKDAIHKITDSNLGNYERFSLIDKYKSYNGGEMLVAFKNIYMSSSEYWKMHKPVLTRSDDSYGYLADALGGLLGTCCSGYMGLIWGAAFSYVMDKADDDIDNDSDDEDVDSDDEEDDNI